MLTKRLRSELKSLAKNPDPDIVLEPHEDDLKRWVAHIRGPSDGPFAGGVFRMRVEAGLQYPMTPPSIVFETKIFHPNVHFKVRRRALPQRRPASLAARRWPSRADDALAARVRAVRRRSACPPRAALSVARAPHGRGSRMRGLRAGGGGDTSPALHTVEDRACGACGREVGATRDGAFAIARRPPTQRRLSAPLRARVVHVCFDVR